MSCQIASDSWCATVAACHEMASESGPAKFASLIAGLTQNVSLTRAIFRGDDRDRTDYLLNAIQALYQLSYIPENLR
ncbi:MAG: hypothetical protein ACD_62C00169G0024 [uncultured bacterium]|nr:MAG: hypothetical protein ACD_62C00169G0024 [uncultured bacterium]